MNLRNMAAAAFFVSVVMSSPVTALTMKQFVDICESSEADCSEHPLLRSYVGGALDLIAVLDEETDYLAQVYCKPPKGLFDVPTIVRYMRSQKTQYADKNAMLAVIRYFEEHGGC